MTLRAHDVLLPLLFLMVQLPATAQTDSTTQKRGPYSVVLTVGSGLSCYATTLGVPAALEQVRTSRFGVPATLRAMWHPDHRLRVGLETGWVPMYSYRGTAAGESARVSVSAIPVLVVFSMPLAWLSGSERSITRRLAISAGTGGYIIQSRLTYEGRVSASRAGLGWMAAGSYTQPINQRFQLATELKWLTSTSTEDSAFTAQIQLVWRAFSW